MSVAVLGISGSSDGVHPLKKQRLRSLALLRRVALEPFFLFLGQFQNHRHFVYVVPIRPVS